MTALCTQLLGQSGGLGGLYLPTTQQPSYAARFDAGTPSNNLALGGSPAIVFGSPVVTPGATGVLPSILLDSTGTPRKYIDTGVPDTSSITVLAVAKANSEADLALGCTIASNFANDQTGTLQFYLNGSGLNAVYSTASSGLNNQSFGTSLTSAQMLAWGLYALRINTTGGASTGESKALTAGASNSVTTSIRYIPASGAKTLQIGKTPANFFTGALSVSEPLIIPYALTDDELAVVAQIVRARTASFGVTV